MHSTKPFSYDDDLHRCIGTAIGKAMMDRLLPSTPHCSIDDFVCCIESASIRRDPTTECLISSGQNFSFNDISRSVESAISIVINTDDTRQRPLPRRDDMRQRLLPSRDYVSNKEVSQYVEGGAIGRSATTMHHALSSPQHCSDHVLQTALANVMRTRHPILQLKSFCFNETNSCPMLSSMSQSKNSRIQGNPNCGIDRINGHDLLNHFFLEDSSFMFVIFKELSTTSTTDLGIPRVTENQVLHPDVLI
jgi:hypothetical protein